ncbi:MAG: methyl-accepting chemotaxis protein [Lachnospiraceae bacterium]|jgi:methyl-accepting chemotaxis protein|nr:methyl-accepting chemotaxis protein [Lachnospiraceae bacterium]
MQMEKQQKMKNGKGAGIRLKINACILATLVVLVALMAVVIGRASQYNAQYSQILDSISKVTFVKDNASYLGRTVVVKCSTGGDIASSGHVEIIDTMERYVAEVGENVPQEAEYSEMRNQFDKFASEAGKFIASFRELQAACGASYSSAGLNAAQDMSGSMSFVSTSAETLLASEIARSELIVDEIQNDFKRTITMIIAAVVFTAIIVIAATFVLTQSMTAPIIQLQKNLTVMSEGNLTGEDIKVKSRDEAGRAASAFNKMKGSLVHLISKVAANMSELKMATATVNNSVDENAQGGTRIADAVEGMLSALERQQEEVSRAREQISDMGNIAGKVADYAEAIHGNAEKTRDNARDGMQKIVAYVEQMQEVNRSMRDMESVFASFGENTKGMTEALASISSIASQTNLLSLNASIEAARAGEAGRGFAVVATEIRNLADDSQAAAAHIGKMIEAVSRQADQMTERLRESLDQLEKGNQMTGEARESFEIITSGTDEVGNSVEDIISGVEVLSERIREAMDSMGTVKEAADSNVTEINEVSAVVAEQSANLEEVSEAMDKLLALTGDVEGLVGEFKI